MAQIQPPETFDFSTPNEWPKWRKRFERYLVVSGMKKKEEADKIDLFMYLMGDRADDIFRTFKFEKEEEATKIDSVLKAFDSHFCVRKNIIYERAKFNSRIQEDREPVDEFITSLYKLADSCEFEGLHEQLIRDRIVVGVRDKALSERMQLDSELTLEKAVKMVRQQEAVRQQQVDLQRPSTSQKVNQVSAVEDSSNLDNDEDECRRRWTAEIQVNGKKVKFKLDSQADVTCVPLCLFKKIMGQQRLVESDINIRAAEFSELQTVGMFISTLRNGNYEIKEKIYVIRRLSEPLLSRRACELLNLARRIEVVATRINPIKKFPEVHIPGKELLDADALSRQPLLTTEGGENERPTSAHINAVLSSITDKDEMLTKIFEAQQEDTTLKAVANYLEQGWPDKKKMSQALLSYWHVKDELGVQNGLLMRGCRLVIPASMKLEILDKLHAGHFGITKTRLRARETVWWPGISEEIAETVRKCSVCIQEAVSKHEPLIPTNFPTRPWQKIGMDLFKFENKWYLVVIDYYSRFPEMIQLDRLTANVVVRGCKSIFARHGVPETVVSDNGTQFGAAREFANFARQYGFTHVTSSPRFPQSNGMAEAGVKIAKLILKKNQDPSLGLLEYRSTPLENGYSPAELLMGRKLRTTLPIAQIILIQNDFEEHLRRLQLVLNCLKKADYVSIPRNEWISWGDFQYQKVATVGLFVCTDYLTKYAITKALPTSESMEVAKFFIEDVILKHGAPRELITDRGRNFTSSMISDLNNQCRITHRKTTAYHPQTNGLTERLNKTIADMLSMYVDVNQKDWDRILPFVTFAYNTAKQESTGFTPFFLVHGREAETPLDVLFPKLLPEDDDFIQTLGARAEEARKLACIHSMRSQDSNSSSSK
ncbi:hypothetical protein LAZ67_11003580 [Cordylochernes scorpioides]|uniref:RNA-directed DNA polymerase n=1 Tax=Cordylochernes scorpioides TaxID=51811 RepID=A0ABY6L3E4_9ARAC|nr:hypothetical protein LAZ67_11003580 [Cordylochernes scorpioides]